MTDSTVTLPVEAIEAAKSIAMWAAVALGGMGALFGVIVRWMMLRIDRSHATLEAAVDSFRDATDKLAAKRLARQVRTLLQGSDAKALPVGEYDDRDPDTGFFRHIVDMSCWEKF